MNWMLTKGRWPVILIMVTFTLFFAFYAKKLQVESDNESMNSETEKQKLTYENFKKLFGSDEVLLLSVTGPPFTNKLNLVCLKNISESIEKIDGVENVLSLVSYDEIYATEDGPALRKLIPAEIHANVIEARLKHNPQLEGFLISRNRKTAGIYIELESRPDYVDFRGRLIQKIQQQTRSFQTKSHSMHLSGVPLQKFEVNRLVKHDQAIVISISTVVLITVLALVFQTMAGVVLPLCVTVICLLWTLGAYSLSGFKLNPITSLLPPVIMVLAISTVVHLYYGWLQSRGENSLDRIKNMLKKLTAPCFFTALTTSFGFISLTFNDIPAVKQFGAFAALGVMLSFLIGIILVPVMLTFVQEPTPLKSTKNVKNVLVRIANYSARYSTMILFVAFCLTIIFSIFIPTIKNNTDLVRFLNDESTLLKDTMFIDEHLTGTNTLDFMLSRKDKKPLVHLQDMQNLEEFDQKIQSFQSVTGAYSIVPAIKQIHRADNDTQTLALPQSEDDLDSCFNLLEFVDNKNDLSRFITEDFKQMRVHVRIKAIGTAESEPLIEHIEQLGKDIFGENYVIEATGVFYGITKDSNNLVRNQLISYGFSLTLSMLAIAVLFRSISIMLLALIPNVFPMVWTAGFMGWSGIELSTGTAMIASVVIGIAVDATIHLLTGYREELKSRPQIDAVKNALINVGPPIMISTFILVVGFWGGCFGSFKPTIYFSFLTGISMISALLCDFLVLPSCIVLFSGRNSKRILGSILMITFLFLPGSAFAEEVKENENGKEHENGTQEDVTLKESPLPGRGKNHGVIRMLKRNEDFVLQITLHSKILKRVVGKLRSKVKDNWGDNADANLFRAALLETRDQSLALFKKRQDKKEKKQSLLIEFIKTHKKQSVEIFCLVSKADKKEKQILQKLNLTKKFILAEMNFISKDNFNIENPWTLIDKTSKEIQNKKKLKPTHSKK